MARKRSMVEGQRKVGAKVGVVMQSNGNAKAQTQEWVSWPRKL